MFLIERNPVSKEIKKMKRHSLTELPDADIVIVLSGNGTIIEKQQPGSDLQRINTGINAVRMITAKRNHMELKDVDHDSITSTGVVFYYNGRNDDQNPAMRKFRQSAASPLPSDPALFVIEDLPNNAQHTGGQADTFMNYIARNPDFKDKRKLIITHEYHVPRVSRYPAFANELLAGSMAIIPVRDSLRRRRKTRKGELQRIKEYTVRGILAKETADPLTAYYLPRHSAKKWKQKT